MHSGETVLFLKVKQPRQTSVFSTVEDLANLSYQSTERFRMSAMQISWFKQRMIDGRNQACIISLLTSDLGPAVPLRLPWPNPERRSECTTSTCFSATTQAPPAADIKPDVTTVNVKLPASGNEAVLIS